VVAVLVALVAVPSGSADKPILKVEDVVVEATGPNGAAVAYKITATDDNGPPSVTCTPPDKSILPLGKTQVSCTAVDTKTAQSATETFGATVRDTTDPVVTVPKPITVEATGPSGAAVTYSGVSATDLVSGTLVPTCDKASGSTFPVGTTTVTCTATDGAGNKKTAGFDVRVADTTPPAVTVPAAVSAEATGPAGATVVYTGVSATDSVSGALTPACDKPSGSAFPIGTTSVTCTATDAAGNKGAASFAITVKDTKAPTIATPGAVTAEATGPAGAAVTYTVTASDAGTVASISCDKPSGSTFQLGATVVTCTASDKSGNSASASFKVTVQDTAPPALGVPGEVTAEAVGPLGAPVVYTVTGTDLVDRSVAPSCARPPGAVFPLGVSTVKCTATDRSGNRSSASFPVTVKDTTGPRLGALEPDIVAEATGPAGSAVGYDSPTAVDAVDGAVPASCSPSSGSTYPLGSTTVTCRATDSRGNVGTGTFSIKVVDTTRPTLTAPGPIVVSSQGSDTVPSTAAAIAAFLGGASGRDIVDGVVAVTNNAPSAFAVGETTVSFVAKDRAGNTAIATSTITVGRTAVATSKPLDRTPPDDVRSLNAKPGDRRVTLGWQRPAADDFDHVVVSRSARGARETTVYTGPAFRLVDRNLTNGIDYRYVVVSFDHAGNRAAGMAVVTAPKATLLVSPADGARVTRPALLRWRHVSGAGYYNVQLFRGATKIMSIWPAVTEFRMPSSWHFGGRSQSLTRGRYRWYVFPGLGPRSANKYGPLLGSSTFSVVAGK